MIKSNKGIIVTGSAKIESKVMNVGNDSNIHVSVTESAIESNKIDLLFEELMKELESLPSENSNEREMIEHFTNQLKLEHKKEFPNQSILSITAKGLLEASETVKKITPNIFDTIKNIYNFFS